VGIAEKQNRPLGVKAAVGIMNDALSRRQADFIKVLSAVSAGCRTIAFDLKDIKALSFSSLLNSDIDRICSLCME
jgi:hypothetical protein